MPEAHAYRLHDAVTRPANMRPLIPLLALAFAAGLGAWLWWGAAGSTPPQRTTLAAPNAPASSSSPSPTTAPPRLDPRQLAPAPTPQPHVADPAGHIALPDGSFVPALNGVRTFDRVRWQGAFPGIEGRFRCPSTGLEWYLLRNGDVLTTARMPGTEGGRPVERDLIVHVRREQVVRVRAPREGR